MNRKPAPGFVDPLRVAPRFRKWWARGGLLTCFPDGTPVVRGAARPTNNGGTVAWGLYRGRGRFGPAYVVPTGGGVAARFRADTVALDPFFRGGGGDELTVAVLHEFTGTFGTYSGLYYVSNTSPVIYRAIANHAGGGGGMDVRGWLVVNGTQYNTANLTRLYAGGGPVWHVLRWRSGEKATLGRYSLDGELLAYSETTSVITGTATVPTNGGLARHMIGSGIYNDPISGTYDVVADIPVYLDDADLAAWMADPFGPWREEEPVEFVDFGTGGGGGVTGVGDGALPGLQGTGSGAVEVSGQGGGSFALLGTGAGAVAVQGAASGAFPGLQGAAEGRVAASGQGTGSFVLLGAAEGSVVASGAGAGAIPELQGVGVGVASSRGVGSGTFTFAGAGAGAVLVSGVGAGVLPGLQGVAVGAIGDVAEGVGDGTLSGLSGTGSGTVRVSGVGAGTFTNFSGVGAGTVEVRGAGIGAFSSLQGSGTGTVAVEGSGGGVLPGLSQAATGSVGWAPVSGAGAGSFAGLAGSGSGAVSVAGASLGLVPGLQGVGAGRVRVSGAGTGSFALLGAGSGVLTGDEVWGEDVDGLAAEVPGGTLVAVEVPGGEIEATWAAGGSLGRD